MTSALVDTSVWIELFNSKQATLHPSQPLPHHLPVDGTHSLLLTDGHVPLIFSVEKLTL